MPPGPWSRAVARYVDQHREGSREGFRVEAHWSKGRHTGLLDGTKAWYLEDVEAAAGALGIDVLDLLASVSADAYGLAAMDMTTPPPTTEPEVNP